MKFVLLIFRNVRRNWLWSAVTAVVTMALVWVVTMVWSILMLLDYLTTEKSQDFKAMVSERWAMPSRLPFSYSHSLARGAARNPGDIQPLDSMTWQFYGGTIDREKLTWSSIVFAIAVEPKKISTMMEGLESDTLPAADAALLQQYIAKLEANRQGLILGQNHLRATKKRIGERIKLFGIGNFKGVDLEFEIVGAFPPGRYDTLAAFHRDYLNNELEAYPRKNNGRQHPLADRSLNLVWLKVPDGEAFNRLAAQIESSPYYTNPAVKCETSASGFASFLEGFRDLIWFFRWLLAPACMATILLVIANAISISVRERRTELAVMKVLGFRPGQILVLVLGESLLLGAGSGFASSALTYFGVNYVLEGIPLQLGFFDRFMVPPDALWWGPAIGVLTAFLGSFLPAWSARNVKVADVFSKVA
jgi:putative ABC transport system permease protein